MGSQSDMCITTTLLTAFWSHDNLKSVQTANEKNKVCVNVPGMTGPPNLAVGPVTLTAILYPQLGYSRRLPKN